MSVVFEFGIRVGEKAALFHFGGDGDELFGVFLAGLSSKQFEWATVRRSEGKVKWTRSKAGFSRALCCFAGKSQNTQMHFL